MVRGTLFLAEFAARAAEAITGMLHAKEPDGGLMAGSVFVFRKNHTSAASRICALR